MAGGGDIDSEKFTGLSKYFNSFTTRGRANCTLATYGALALLYFYFKLKPSKKTE